MHLGTQRADPLLPCASLPAHLPPKPLPPAQSEYERVKAAYTQMSANLEALASEKRALEAQVAQLSTDGTRSERDRRALEQQVADLSRQIARLLREIQGLQSGLPGGAAAAGASAVFEGGDASDVTTQRLLVFKDIEVRGERQGEAAPGPRLVQHVPSRPRA